MTEPQVSFPRRSARTLRFSLGLPRNFVVSADGSRVVFLRTPSGTDRRTMLWVADVIGGGLRERVIADPQLLTADDETLTDAERARRERAREGAAGIVSFATDRALTRATFVLSGRLYVAELTGEPRVRELAVTGPVFDPRLDPTGRQIAYVADNLVRVVEVATGADRAVPGQDQGPNVSWGLAEFIAAEEMGRSRGYWWSPDSSALLATRVDISPVSRWHIADPAHPDRPTHEIAYPAAGSANAGVDLYVLPLHGGNPVRAHWDSEAFEYLCAVHWSRFGPPLLSVQSRDQRRVQTLTMDPLTGATGVLHTDSDPAWVELVDGVPAWTPDGELVRVADADGRRRLFVGETMLSAELQVRAVAGTVPGDGNTEVLFLASADDPTEVRVYRTDAAGPVELSQGAGVHSATAAGTTMVITSAVLTRPGRRSTVLRDGVALGVIADCAEDPGLRPQPRMLLAGPNEIRTALLLPTGHQPGTPLPVLMDPYGGPHAQRVLATANAFLESQWWADQGFAVVIADGRGTPGRGSDWERAVHLDLATPVLADQVDALHAAAAECPDLDLSRVGIRGWSFGGYLAALAVLRRPDVFHAAIAGAPVTDWALYDTHYTERYLGTPASHPEVYSATSLLTDAEKLERPLLLVHGLADDNVVAAHTLQLSAALLAAGRPHQVLPLSGVTHMTPQEVVAENLLLFQLDFLRRALGVN
jgi:dipeptidyl-peptidase-4